MQENYFSFLDHRVTQRRLAAKFSRPRLLTLHTLAFLAAMTAIWAYGTAWGWWYIAANYVLPGAFGLFWSLLLVFHAVWHYRRSAASAERREVAVEDEMRQLIAQSGSPIENDQLFTMHLSFEAALERQGNWSALLLMFAVINALSWGISAFNLGSSWPFQTTLPFAVAILGGGMVYSAWLRARHQGRINWFTRIPFNHIVLYIIGAVGLALLGAYHVINYWDAQTLIGWWLIAVLAHIVLAEAVLPLIRRFMPKSTAKLKRDPSQRLMLGDDGEITEVIEQENRQPQASQL